MLPQNLAVSIGMIVLCVLVHAWGTAALVLPLRTPAGHRWRQGRPAQHACVLIYVVLGLIVLHAVEIMLYGALYLGLGEFKDIEHSLYFASTTFSSLGFGDVIISENWRLTSSIEGVIGLILIGWSTAILAAVTARMGVFDVHRESSEQADASRD